MDSLGTVSKDIQIRLAKLETRVTELEAENERLKSFYTLTERTPEGERRLKEQFMCEWKPFKDDKSHN